MLWPVVAGTSAINKMLAVLLYGTGFLLRAVERTIYNWRSRLPMDERCQIANFSKDNHSPQSPPVPWFHLFCGHSGEVKVGL